VQVDPGTMAKIASLPDVAYTQRAAMMLAFPVAIDGRTIPAPVTSPLALLAIPCRPRAG
jgi:hypothetical protein